MIFLAACANHLVAYFADEMEVDVDEAAGA